MASKILRARPGVQPSRVEITAGYDKSGAMVSVDNAHHEVHEGNMYIIHRMVDTLADDASINILLRNLEEEIHTVWFVAAGGDAQFFVYENPTISNNGTTVPVYNVNRGSANTSFVLATHTPTVGGVGTQLLGKFLPGGTGGNAGGGSLRQGTELILGAGRTYLFRLTNISGQAKVGCVIIEFYEE